MALTQRLDLRQSQSLVMTPQLQQAIKLLQLSNLELTAFVEQELERNPLLERDDARETSGLTDEAQATGHDRIAPEADLPGTPDRLGTDRLANDNNLAGADSAPLDTDYENVWTGNAASEPDTPAPNGESFNIDGPTGQAPEPELSGLAGWTGKGGRPGFDSPDYDMENQIAGELDLRSRLLEQLAADVTDPTERLIGAALIDLIDEAGYLTDPLDETAIMLGIEEPDLLPVLKRLQRFDPVGCFCSDLKECLSIQLQELDRFDPAMQALMANLPKLAARDFTALRRICGVDAEDLADMIQELRALDPKPGTRYRATVAQTVTPDIVMRPLPKGGWAVELNSETLPRVLVNRSYYMEVTSGSRSREDKDYLSECWASATWLTKSLHQRAQTIMKVAGEIVRQQDAFFRHGVQHLKPLILRDIADAIEMHESTVSRVTTNKYMATPRGVYELKYFFTAAIQGADGQAAHSAEAVRHRIKALIDAEDPKSILSDDKIVEILRADGVDIARRTVAKYREALRLPSSVQRRREKALMAGG